MSMLDDIADVLSESEDSDHEKAKNQLDMTRGIFNLSSRLEPSVLGNQSTFDAEIDKEKRREDSFDLYGLADQVSV